ncbi:MAG TPA: hypothetical protein VNL73_08515 [Verrucomicrobiae bacterium]|nr:hypothetical protein [Verrucomicrobiae bacterium]
MSSADRTRRLLSVLLLFFFSSAIWAGEPKTVFTIKYVSADHVYLSGGTADGLAVGDGLIIMEKGKIKASLEVDFTAEHSASCEVLLREGEIQIGDVAVKEETIGEAAVPRPAVVTTPPPPAPARRAFPASGFGATRLATLSGSFSALYHNWNDNSPNGLDFSQSSARLNLTARRLWDREITFTLRARGRYDQRSRAYSSTVPKNEWVNHVSELYLAFDDEKAPFNFYAGRFLPRRVSTAGYLDGALLEKRFSDFVRAGTFAGLQPEWMYTNIGLPLQKGGVYLNYTRGAYQANRLELTLAAAGSYHDFYVNREFFYLQGYWGLGERFSFGQNTEVDYNRRWRREKMGDPFTLTNLYSFARYRVSQKFSASLNYDRGLNYWTYETQYLADTLFDRRMREGLRLQFDFDRLAKYYGVVGAGIRNRKGDSRPTYTYTAGLTRRELFSRRTSANISAGGFSGPLESGYNFSLRADQYLFGSNYASAGWGLYTYKGSGPLPRRVNHTFDFSLRLDLAFRLFFSGQMQYSTGDDIRGTRLQGEVGYFF